MAQIGAILSFYFDSILFRIITLPRTISLRICSESNRIRSIGSGVTEENMETYLDANALIVGSYFKKDGYWGNSVDVQKTKAFMNKIRALRTKRESKL